MSTPARFVVAYVAVLAIMLAWSLVMKKAATIGPIQLLVVAYTVPVAAWWAVASRTRHGQAGNHER